MYVCMYVCITAGEKLVKSWYTTPRNPEEADPPRIVGQGYVLTLD